MKSKSNPKSRKSGHHTNKTGPIIGSGNHADAQSPKKKKYDDSDASSDVSSELSSLENSPRGRNKKSKDQKKKEQTKANNKIDDPAARDKSVTEEELKAAVEEDAGYNAELQEELRIQQLKKDILSND